MFGEKKDEMPTLTLLYYCAAASVAWLATLGVFGPLFGLGPSDGRDIAGVVLGVASAVALRLKGGI